MSPRKEHNVFQTSKILRVLIFVMGFLCLFARTDFFHLSSL